MIVYLILFILSCISCMCSSSSSIKWYYTGIDLNSKRMCNTSENIKVPGLSNDTSKVLLCPLNQEIVSSYIFDATDDLYYRTNYTLKTSKITPLYYFNSYFLGETPPPLKDLKKYILYCDDKFIYCGENNKLNPSDDIIITEDIFYLGYLKDETYFYCHVEFFTKVAKKLKFDTLDDFLFACDQYDYHDKRCLTSISKEDQKKLYNKCLFFYGVQKAANDIPATIARTLLPTLNDTLLKEYLNILEKKKTKDKKMTTFEFFMYLALQIKLYNIEYMILKKNKT